MHAKAPPPAPAPAPACVVANARRGGGAWNWKRRFGVLARVSEIVERWASAVRYPVLQARPEAASSCRHWKRAHYFAKNSDSYLPDENLLLMEEDAPNANCQETAAPPQSPFVRPGDKSHSRVPSFRRLQHPPEPAQPCHRGQFRHDRQCERRRRRRRRRGATGRGEPLAAAASEHVATARLLQHSAAGADDAPGE